MRNRHLRAVKYAYISVFVRVCVCVLVCFYVNLESRLANAISALARSMHICVCVFAFMCVYLRAVM